MNNIIPKPVSVTPVEDTFTLTNGTKIWVQPGIPEVAQIGRYLAGRLRPATGYALPVSSTPAIPSAGNINLVIPGVEPDLGVEGYELVIAPEGVKLAANQPAGLMRGVQTLRQLLPPSVESTAPQTGPWELPAGTIRDYPRFAWRGAMLDVARHFFGVEDVKRFIDLLAYYKLNGLHLHLTDDQGWRIDIKSWPRLATVGGSTEVGGGKGGYYSQQEYAEIVAYAQERYITVVPEIDMPSHTNAALASYAELNCDGVAPALYTGTEVGFSSLCTGKAVTYQFLDDVVRELAQLTPGPYLHVGGDEAASTPPEEYVPFMERVQGIVQSHGKEVIGWEEMGQVRLLPTTVVQHWDNRPERSVYTLQAVQQGAKILMSPAQRVYVDMKYTPDTPLGLSWAAFVEVQDAYDWDPATELEGVTESDIVGIEAALWTETVQTLDDLEFLVFPRLPGIAEVAWSPGTGKSWAEYRNRLGAHGPRMTALGIDFYRSPQVPWQ